MSRAVLEKRLLYKATHRGMREADKLLEAFLCAVIETADEDDLKVLEHLLDWEDGLWVRLLSQGLPAPLLLRTLVSFAEKSKLCQMGG